MRILFHGLAIWEGKSCATDKLIWLLSYSMTNNISIRIKKSFCLHTHVCPFLFNVSILTIIVMIYFDEKKKEQKKKKKKKKKTNKKKTSEF